MDEIDRLIEEHAALRRLAGDIEKIIGPCRDVGWDDRADFDVALLRTAQERFHRELREHERKEYRLIAERERLLGPGAEELESVIDRAHASLEEMDRLLSAIAGTYDGTHAHAVRRAAAELCRELETHMTYEEKVLFPLLRRG